METNRSLNYFCECHKRKLARSFLSSSFCVCVIAKSSSSLLILLRLMNSSKLVRRAILGGFVAVDTWSPDVSVDRDLPFRLFACTHTLVFGELISCMLGWLELRKIFGSLLVIYLNALQWLSWASQKCTWILLSFFNVSSTAFQHFEPDNFTLQW